MANQTTATVTTISVRISFSSSISELSLSAASALTTYTSFTTSTFVSDGTIYKESFGAPVIVTNSAEFTSLSADGAFNIDASSSSTVRRSSSTVTATSSTYTPASSSSPVPQRTSIGAGAGAGIGIAGIILLLGLISGIVWYLRRRRRLRQERPPVKAVVEVKSQLEDTSTAWRDNIHKYKRELSAGQEIHELDAETGKVLPPELRVGLNSNSHEMESCSERNGT